MGAQSTTPSSGAAIQKRSAPWLTDILGLPDAFRFGPFLVVEMGNGVSLDYHETDDEIAGQHGLRVPRQRGHVRRRVRSHPRSGDDYWADPGRQHRGEINRNDGGRGVYFEDPDGHLMEIITRPYGSG